MIGDVKRHLGSWVAFLLVRGSPQGAQGFTEVTRNEPPGLKPVCFAAWMARLKSSPSRGTVVVGVLAGKGFLTAFGMTIPNLRLVDRASRAAGRNARLHRRVVSEEHAQARRLGLRDFD